MKNNNTFSHHRMMNQCTSYKGKEMLNIYMNWNNSETKEIIMLGLKFGKTIYGQNKHLAIDEANLPPKWAAPYPRFGETWVMPPPHPRQGKKDICIISSDDDFLLLHINTRVNNRVLLNYPFLRTIHVYKMFPRRRRKFMPKTKLPHQSFVCNPMQTSPLKFHK